MAGGQQRDGHDSGVADPRDRGYRKVARHTHRVTRSRSSGSVRARAPRDQSAVSELASGLLGLLDRRNDPRAKVLVIDGDKHVVDVLSLGLMYEGFDVVSCGDGRRALQAFDSHKPDFVILEAILPGVDGLEICRQLRRTDDTPIIMVTGRCDVQDRVSGLDAGADDYLIKPFDFRELVARVRAVRRRFGATQDQIEIGNVSLDRVTRTVSRDGASVQLSTREFDLLELLMSHPRQVLSREVILNRVWGYDWVGTSNTVDVYIRYLRGKVDVSPPRLIQTVRGVGYSLRPPA
ncbi:MAG: response regulator transcription factor [Chloroflexi bacterium]|nr:response regulator transcription factor [Chloroflexota bacterium]